MQPNAIILIAEGFEDIEAISAIDVLRRAEIDVTVCGITQLKVKAARGTYIICDSLLKSEEEKLYDAVILPGGLPGAKNLANDTRVSQFIKRHFSQEKWIAAICAAPALVLSPLGILNGLNATCYPAFSDQLSKDTNYLEDTVVTDQKIITSQGPATAIAFSLEIVSNLKSKELSGSIAKEMLAN